MSQDGPESPEDFFELGKRFYLPSSGVADPLLALYYFQRSAEGGHVPAQRVLGTCYLEGGLTAPDYGKALDWLTQAAKKNDGQAAFALATMYVNGLGVERNWQAAYKLLNMKSAAALPEARRLKEELKAQLRSRFPDLVSQLESAEKKRRSAYTRHRQRFIQPWATPGRPQLDEEEFSLWLNLAAGGLSPQDGLLGLLGLMDSYYNEQEALHSPTGK